MDSDDQYRNHQNAHPAYSFCFLSDNFATVLLTIIHKVLDFAIKNHDLKVVVQNT
jgi:hypothetical protein